MVIIAFLLFGVLGLRSLKSSYFPLTESHVVQISVVYPGASPMEIEEGVILKIEDNLKGLRGVERVTSISRENSGSITVEVEEELDINFMLLEVKNAVNFISKYETTLVNVCKKKSYDGVICGHIHHAAIEDYEGITYHNCGDWVESCTALVEDHDGNISLIDYSKENRTINLKRILTAEKAA